MIKICGITNAEDAQAAADGGATAIGFNFWPRSPRYIDPGSAAAIATPPGVLRVGVFVNEPADSVERIARLVRLDVVQLHGDEKPEQYPRLPEVWKALRVNPGFRLADYAALPVQALLLDGPAAELYGGSGMTFDWSVAAGFPRRIVIAGGLDASNVARAVALADPWGVDTCSRIESAPGKKDLDKMKQFLSAAKAALSK
jgi:phosphoribosylanthranilate isomerase